MCFSVNFAKFLRTPLFTEPLRTTASINITLNSLLFFDFLCIITTWIGAYGECFGSWGGS